MKTDKWKAIDNEIKQYPAPKDSVRSSGRQMVIAAARVSLQRRWHLADVVGRRGPIHGTWRIEGNQFFTTASIGPSDPAEYTIILITKKDFVIADQSSVFYETRLN